LRVLLPCEDGREFRKRLYLFGGEGRKQLGGVLRCGVLVAGLAGLAGLGCHGWLLPSWAAALVSMCAHRKAHGVTLTRVNVYIVCIGRQQVLKWDASTGVMLIVWNINTC